MGQKKQHAAHAPPLIGHHLGSTRSFGVQNFSLIQEHKVRAADDRTPEDAAPCGQAHLEVSQRLRDAPSIRFLVEPSQALATTLEFASLHVLLICFRARNQSSCDQ